MTYLTEIKAISIVGDEEEKEVNSLLQKGWVYLNSFSSARFDISSRTFRRIGDDVIVVLGKPQS